MDLQALEYTREHYDRHAGQYADSREALAARAMGPGAPLKKFHNQIKRQLIQRFARGAPRLLDLCCGRGGDIWKWIDAGIHYVKGIDLSEAEVQEACKRFAEAVEKRQGNLALNCDFVATPNLGISEWREEEPYDVVTCMFAIHYFFVSEPALKQFLHNVAINLKDGGYFIGTVPDGKRINACIKDSKVYSRPMLHIEAHWVGQPQCFGSPYICSIGDTVTSGAGDIGSSGSLEYLVYFNALEGVAAKYGLRLVTDYGDPALNAMFEREDSHKGFKHFWPRFPPESDPSLTRASAINVAFVFQKVTEKPGLALVADTHAASKQDVQQGEQQQQQQRKHERLPDAAAAPAGKRARLEDAPGDSLTQPPAADGAAHVGQAGVGGAAAAAPALVAGKGTDGQQGEQETQRDGGVARQEYKRPTARRRVNGGVGSTQ